MLLRFLALCALMTGPLALVADASGDVCRAAPDHPACTILRPAQDAPGAVEAAQECVVIVGGLGSPVDGSDAAFFDAALGGIGDDPRFRPVRFGVDDGAYDTLGAISQSGEELRAALWRASRECGALHLVAHSMGGVVADRALSKAIPHVATYVALASPHNGASAARAIRPAIEADVLFASGAGLAADALDLHDPRADAVRDLAHTRAPLPPRTGAAVRLRLVTDPLVLRRDHFDRRVDVREYLPMSRAELEGHGQVVNSALVQRVVGDTIRDGRAPLEERSALELAEAAALSIAIDDALASVEDAARAALLSVALASRTTPLGFAANLLAR